MLVDSFTSPAMWGNLPPLPKQRPLLMVGHGTKDTDGRQAFLDFVAAYQELDTSRPVIPCFLELTAPLIPEGVERCVAEGFTDITVLPVLLFAARHTKFDVTNELDRLKQRYPFLQFHYGRHFGNTPLILDLWRDRLAQIDPAETIKKENTVLLIVGRGSSDPDANSDVYKFSRLLWEGSNYRTVETCFIGITHPRLEEGFERARLYQPQRIIVLPHFLFTGALVKKINRISAQQQAQYPATEIINLPEIGFTPELMSILREREIESQLGQTQMNCEMCKFRLAAVSPTVSHHHHAHEHHHDHPHAHEHPPEDPYADLEQYHQKIWQVP
ncbi:MAG: sirohydrochlorin chelatase [Gomphosphaeria aponina SAG 52.96 = DSM 107014]|uniref:Sirohydrochlorin chelatase n=1 Tax=Gomphosphaeria aponina SAG 52.96 = DSM 107014 TaxID=1521640 RepID=A0A941GQX4_9CHRO|nr:sirohydrochlorin chelatase [Gomphosphaeria aponina SAG 52.96 = DSM 107014]